ncbi:MAG: hypothetical protein QNJ57_11980 [Flavobacteriaceae bacterium]|nr:hypothetical protein [Flavobacteriaceae bacterium]
MAKFLINDDCCREQPGNGDSENKDCLDNWKKQLEEVCNEFNIKSAITQQSKAAYENSQAWEAKLENWKKIIEESDKKAKEIIRVLGFFLAQIKTVCKNAKCTNKTIEMLLCLVKSIYDCLATYDENNPGLKKQIEELKKLLNCLTNVKDDVKAEVLKCIEAYEEKIIVVCETQDATLNKLLETLKCAQLLYAAICDKEDGLKVKIKNMQLTFEGKLENHESSSGTNSESQSTAQVGHCDPEDEAYPCADKDIGCEGLFPIDANPYTSKISQDFTKADVRTKELEELWIANKKESDKTLSKKNSLKEAIDAAEAAKSGK